MKRFAETRKWQNTWFMDLPAKYKLAWLWLVDNCDHAGLIDANPRLMSFMVGEPIDGEEFIRVMAGRVTKPKAGKWFIPSFINFQYGEELNPRNSAHRGVLRILSEQQIDCPVSVVEETNKAPDKGQSSPSKGAQDKDKDKEQDKDKDLVLVAPDQPEIPLAKQTPTQADAIWALYPKKSGKKEAFPEINAAIKAHGFEKIREAVAAYAAAVATWQTADHVYIPDPVRWFKRGKYDDDRSTWQRGTVAPTYREPKLRIE